MSLASWALLALTSLTATAAPLDVPRCRLDGGSASEVSRTLQSAAAAYVAMGKPLPFDKVVVNPQTPSTAEHILDVYLVKDAAKDAVSKDGCAAAIPKRDEELDELSVRGGCVVTAVQRLELRCSAEAVRLFGDVIGQPNRSNPALLYVLAHELGHVYQKRLGEYSGRVEQIDLSKPKDTKLRQLRDSCEPSDVKREADADAMSVNVLKHLLPKPPYREPAFSEQGSVYWAVDQLYLAANGWQQAATEREFISQSRPHASFVPTEFPTPSKTVDLNARKFVCEVLTKRKGWVQYPLRAIDHPPLEQRMRVVAEAMKPIAAGLPTSDGTQQFRSVAVLQEQLSPIFTHIYRETGVYMEAVRRRVCTRVNSDTPTAGCSTGL